ncbi:MAG: 50S ribosomal protein P1 [Aigarchaeota archaeon]|nr:50S ribosomal protein P1 [Candidatus Pelearchaeum maunauluense]
MEYIYAALLLHKAGKQIDEEGVKKVLTAAGVTPDDAKVKSLVAALSEINIEETLKQAVMAPAAVVAAPAPAQAPQAPAKEEKKEEKKEEAIAGLSALFG